MSSTGVKVTSFPGVEDGVAVVGAEVVDVAVGPEVPETSTRRFTWFEAASFELKLKPSLLEVSIASEKNAPAFDGTADVKKNSRRVNTLGPGDFFGEIALVSREPRTATVIATSPVRALVITDRSFRRLLDDAPQVQTKVMEAMAERLAPETL